MIDSRPGSAAKVLDGGADTAHNAVDLADGANHAALHNRDRTLYTGHGVIEDHLGPFHLYSGASGRVVQQFVYFYNLLFRNIENADTRGADFFYMLLGAGRGFLCDADDLKDLRPQVEHLGSNLCGHNKQSEEGDGLPDHRQGNDRNEDS